MRKDLEKHVKLEASFVEPSRTRQFRTGFFKSSRTTHFGVYRTIPAKNRYGLAIKNGKNPELFKKSRIGPVLMSFVWLSPVSIWFGLVRVEQYNHGGGFSLVSLDPVWYRIIPYWLLIGIGRIYDTVPNCSVRGILYRRTIPVKNRYGSALKK